MRRTTALDCLHTHLQALLQSVSSTGIVPLVRDLTAFETRLAESTPDTMVLKRTCCITPLPANCRQKQQKTDQKTLPRESISPDDEKKNEGKLTLSPEQGSEELGSARQDGGEMYPGAEEVSKRPVVPEDALVAKVSTSPCESKAVPLLLEAPRTTSTVLVLNSGCCCCLDSGLPRSSPRKSRKTG